MTTPATRTSSPPTDLTEAFQRIRDHGGRVTAGKRALAELLYSQPESLTADEIATQLHDHDRSAIYRNLAQFEELGIAEHLHLGHGQAVYRRTGLASVPVVCSRCGTAVDLARTHTRAFARTVANHTGIALDLTHFPLTGVCAACASSDEPS